MNCEAGQPILITLHGTDISVFPFFLWWRKPKTRDKTTVHSQSVEKTFPYIRPGRVPNPGRKVERPERYRSANCAPTADCNMMPIVKGMFLRCLWGEQEMDTCWS